jgi:hypothetical protein
MKFSKNLFYVAACSVATLALSVSANAQLSGQAYLASGAAGQFATNTEFTAAAGSNLGAYTFNLAGSNITFSVGNSATQSGSTFVTSGGGVITSSTTASGLAGTGPASAAPMSGGSGNSSGCPGGSCYSTIMDIRGTYLGGAHSFNVTNDDGVNVYINGVLQNNTQNNENGGPTGSGFETYNLNAAAGSTFDLVYDECCGGPATLTTNLTGIVATPEPGSIALLATALFGVGAIYRRRRNAA